MTKSVQIVFLLMLSFLLCLISGSIGCGIVLADPHVIDDSSSSVANCDADVLEDTAILYRENADREINALLNMMYSGIAAEVGNETILVSDVRENNKNTSSTIAESTMQKPVISDSPVRLDGHMNVPEPVSVIKISNNTKCVERLAADAYIPNKNIFVKESAPDILEKQVIVSDAPQKEEIVKGIIPKSQMEEDSFAEVENEEEVEKINEEINALITVVMQGVKKAKENVPETDIVNDDIMVDDKNYAIDNPFDEELKMDLQEENSIENNEIFTEEPLSNDLQENNNQLEPIQEIGTLNVDDEFNALMESITGKKPELSMEMPEIITQNSNEGMFLLSVDTADPNYQGTTINLSPENRSFIEHVVQAECNTSYIGAALVAQCIRDTMVNDGLSAEEVQRNNSYSYTSMTPYTVVRQAVSDVFDSGVSGVQHRIIYFYAPSIVSSAFHESQEYVVSYDGHRYFDRR